MAVPVLVLPWSDYEWIVIMGAIMAFYMAWGIGANDVANAFATSVGSKALKLWQACLIAAVMEFTGAVALGGEVAKTVAGSIADVNTFKEYPELYMYGMLCALAAAATWLLVATYFLLPVSTTHSIIGAIMGFAMVWNGVNGVLWNQHMSTFPYSKGFVPVVCAWFVAPISAGIVSSIIFFVNRLLILRRQNSTKIAFWVLPILVFLTLFINLQFVLFKGASKELAWSSSHAAWVAACAAAGACVLSIIIGIPLMRRRFAKDLADEKAAEENGGKEIEIEKTTEERFNLSPHAIPDTENPFSLIFHYVVAFFVAMKNQLLRGLFYNVHVTGTEDAHTQSIHQAAEVFDPHTEQVYKYLQVFSACCVSFAHGANDVANSIGPFSGIWYVYNTGKITSTVDAPKWIFVMGGLGLVVGLMTYGYNIIMQLGVKMLKLTPSRGFSAELSAALTVSVASRYGLPVSTTQIIVGAEIGVGLVENVRTGLNYWVIIKTFMGWVITIFIAGLTSAAIFAQGVYAPSINNVRALTNYKDNINKIVSNLTSSMTSANAKFKLTATNATSQYWVGAAPDFVKVNGSVYNKTIVDRAAALKKTLAYKSAVAYVMPETMIYYLNVTVNDYVAYTSMFFGQKSKAAILNNTAEFTKVAL